MNNLRRSRTRLILQAISIILGLFGVASVCFAVYIFLASLSENNYPGLGIALVELLVGCYLIFSAYLMIRKFSESAIKQFCAIIAVFLGGSLIQILNKYIPSPFETRAGILIIILPLLLTVLLYAIGQKILIKLTIHKESS